MPIAHQCWWIFLVKWLTAHDNTAMSDNYPKSAKWTCIIDPNKTNKNKPWFLTLNVYIIFKPIR